MNHRVDWFRRDPGGGTISVKPAATSFAEVLPALIEAKNAPVTEHFTGEQYSRLMNRCIEHVLSCDCFVAVVRHYVHSTAETQALIHEVLYDVAVRPEPPHGVGPECVTCGQEWPTRDTLRRLQYECALPVGVCPACGGEGGWWE